MARELARKARPFRPTIDSGSREAWQLEPRLLLSRAGARVAAVQRQAPAVRARGIGPDGIPTSPQPFVQVGVATGGVAAAIVDTDGELWIARLQRGGTVRAKAAPGGMVDLFLYGTNNQSVFTIDPAAPTPGPNSAHSFPLGSTHQDGLLHVRNITVVNGRVNQLLGYQTAEISGAVKVLGKRSPSPTVDRIAFYSLKPGASIEVFGDLNTLNVFDSITLDTGPGIRVGRDLNWFLVGADVTLQNGTSIIVGRDIGLAPQGRKGSAPGGVGGLIQGDLIVGAGSTIAVGRDVDAPIIVQGSSAGISNLPANVQAATIVIGTRG